MNSAKPFFFIAIVIAFHSCDSPSNTAPNKQASTPEVVEVDELYYADPPPVRTYPSSMETVNTWVTDMDTEKIRAHAWDMWESITTPTIVGLPVWETWYSGHEIFELDSQEERKIVRNFHFPTQFFHASAITAIPEDPAERPTSFNRFTRSVANVIWDKGYNKKSVLTEINNEFDATGTAPLYRQIQTSIDTVDELSIVLKPVFQFISKDSAVAIPYWAGVSPQTTSDMTNPEPHTWKQFVVVDPTGQLPVGSMYPVDGQEWPVVSISDFYAIQLTAEDSINFSQFAAESGDNVGLNNNTSQEDILTMVRPGNYALLTAMHVTGKEIPNWTWQTFWWSPDTQNPVFGADRPATIGSPWSNYNMRTAYYMVAPPNTEQGGEPLISFNPYLETNLSGKVPTVLGDSVQWYGVFSNCMSCHRMAAFPNSFYTPNGYINPADPFRFSKNTKTDFLWSIPTRAN